MRDVTGVRHHARHCRIASLSLRHYNGRPVTIAKHLLHRPPDFCVFAIALLREFAVLFYNFRECQLPNEVETGIFG